MKNIIDYLLKIALFIIAIIVVVSLLLAVWDAFGYSTTIWLRIILTEMLAAILVSVFGLANSLRK
jgi:hypothetical protein